MHHNTNSTTKMIQVGSRVRHIDQKIGDKMGVMEVIEIIKKTHAVCECPGNVKFFFPLSELKLHNN